MIRRTRQREYPVAMAEGIARLRDQLVNRRRFMIHAAGGSAVLMFGLPQLAAGEAYDPWPTLDAVLRHLLPSEPDSPGAAEINALDYLRFVVTDPKVDRETREFIVQGNRWLDDLARQQHAQPFVALDTEHKEQLLRRTAESSAGENWIATLLTYLFEALLTAPAYGGNPDGIGWRWLQYVPGFPLPGPGTRYPELPL